MLSRWTIFAIAVCLAVTGLFPMTAGASGFPQRQTPIPETTDSVPHVQIGAVAVPELTAKLLSSIDALPGVSIRDTVISLPGAKGFWISQDVSLKRPEAIVGGREFAHVHPDGSLHASLNPDTARKAVEAGWATFHPWSSRRPGWEGFVMIYSPQTEEELEVVINITASSYEYVTGQKVE